MALDIQYSDRPLGHKVRGLDVTALDDATFREVEDLYDRYGVIIITDQHLSPDEQIAFSSRFGPLALFPLPQYNMPGAPEIMIVSNVIENGKPIGMADAGRYWHTDMWHTPNPPRGSILYAVEVPEKDGVRYGDTMFTNTAETFDRLPEALKKQVDGRQAVYSTAKSAKFRRELAISLGKLDESTQSAREGRKVPDLIHPLVRIHPRTGRKCLYLGGQSVISKIIGMDEKESDDIVDELMKLATRDEMVYRHKWTVGDMVMWDNCSCMHNAIGDFDLPLRRRMHRTTLQ